MMVRQWLFGRLRLLWLSSPSRGVVSEEICGLAVTRKRVLFELTQERGEFERTLAITVCGRCLQLSLLEPSALQFGVPPAPLPLGAAGQPLSDTSRAAKEGEKRYSRSLPQRDGGAKNATAKVLVMPRRGMQQR